MTATWIRYERPVNSLEKSGEPGRGRAVDVVVTVLRIRPGPPPSFYGVNEGLKWTLSTAHEQVNSNSPDLIRANLRNLFEKIILMY